MKKSNILFITIVFVMLATSLGLALVVRQDQVTETRVFAENVATLAPRPTPVVPSPVQTEEMDSPDGTQTLTMNFQQTGNRRRYSFFTSSKEETSDQTLIFSQESSADKTLSIPFNTWSPDNTYLFLEESSVDGTDFLVFSTEGKPFDAGDQYLDVQALFAEKVEGYSILEVTGWAAPNLLLVNAQASEGDQKVSFWFDVTSQSFIRLSTYFF